MVEFTNLVFTLMPSESYCALLRSLLCWCDVLWVLMISPVHRFLVWEGLTKWLEQTTDWLVSL